MNGNVLDSHTCRALVNGLLMCGLLATADCDRGAGTHGAADAVDAAAEVTPDSMGTPPRDVEAMYVAPNGDMLLITKRPLDDPARRP